MRQSRIPTFVTPLAQGVVDEAYPNFGGLYAGVGSHLTVQEFVEDADLVLHLGPLDTDVTTFLGSARLTESATVRAHSNELKIGSVTYPGVGLRQVIFSMLDRLDFTKLALRNIQKEQLSGLQLMPKTLYITQDWFWSHMSS